jgi:hypothetical protein
MSRCRLAGFMAALVLAAAATSCAEKPYLSAGDAKSAEVGYTRDLAAATEVAREHCARYEKVPRYLDSSENIAYFACEPHP